MDYQDSLLLDVIYIKDSTILDAYGLKVGDKFSQIKDKRGKGKINFEPYHQHLYYSYDSSNIYYELNGDFGPFEVDQVTDIVFTESDLSIAYIQNIIWRK